MIHSSARPLLILALVVALAVVAQWALAREAVVTTTSGRTFTGEVLSETPQQVVLEIAGIRTPINRADIENIEYKKTPEEEYAERRAALADDDYGGRFGLALDLYNQRALPLSLRELRSMKADFADRDLTEVDRLITLVNNQMALQQQPPAPSRPSGQQSGDAATQPGARTAPGEVPLLTEQQISTIRLWELPTNLAQARPRVIVPRDVLDDLFTRYAHHPDVPRGRDEQRRFRALEGWQQLDRLFQVQARDLYPRVIVREDPPALIEFRRTINPIYVVRYFRATFQDKVEGLDLQLAGRDPNSIPEVYTNFYLLSQAQYQGHRLIDRDNPMDSLLIQWGLPRDAARYPAPDVPNWRPFFRSLDDPRLTPYVQWIESLFKRPDYGITYPPPAEGESAPDAAAAPRQPAP